MVGGTIQKAIGLASKCSPTQAQAMGASALTSHFSLLTSKEVVSIPAHAWTTFAKEVSASKSKHSFHLLLPYTFYYWIII